MTAKEYARKYGTHGTSDVLRMLVDGRVSPDKAREMVLEYANALQTMLCAENAK